MSAPQGWGPSHQTAAKKKGWDPPWWLSVSMGVFGALYFLTHLRHVVSFAFAVMLAIALLVVDRLLIAPRRRPAGSLTQQILAATDPIAALQATSHNGVYLGLTDDQGWQFSAPERAVLILGPPRAGKTSGVIIPALIAHPGPAVSTSTKPDVLRATRAARAQGGRVWVFDPTGTTRPTVGEGLRWSPVAVSREWDGAWLMARAMTANVGVGTTDRSHWANRAQALLGPLLHAAAIDRQEMDVVVGWVMGHQLDPAGVILERPDASQLAFQTLLGIHHTEARERASIFSAAADALQAYTSDAALAAARAPNFDAAQFVQSRDTVYIHAPADRQAAVAPIVCGLLTEIRRATYTAHARGAQGAGRMLFALDEVANIAPLPELPQIASEGGGQGLTLLAALQDLSQARHRWGEQADGFLTLFGAKVLLPGIADTKTLEAVSTMLGEYDRQVVARTTTNPDLAGALAGQHGSRSTSVSTQRTRILSPGEIARIPAGHLLHLESAHWQLLTLTPAYSSEPWRTLTAGAAATTL